jgi:hypothetical protein
LTSTMAAFKFLRSTAFVTSPSSRVLPVAAFSPASAFHSVRSTSDSV